MSPHITLTPKIFKLDVHLGYMLVPLSTNFPIKTRLLQEVFKSSMIFGVPYNEPGTVRVNVHTMVYGKTL